VITVDLENKARTGNYENLQNAVLSKPEIVGVPMPTEVTECYLAVREVGAGQVITVIDLLLSKNNAWFFTTTYIQKIQSR